MVTEVCPGHSVSSPFPHLNQFFIYPIRLFYPISSVLKIDYISLSKHGVKKYFNFHVCGLYELIM
jgi:hypothetical protein